MSYVYEGRHVLVFIITLNKVLFFPLPVMSLPPSSSSCLLLLKASSSLSLKIFRFVAEAYSLVIRFFNTGLHQFVSKPRILPVFTTIFLQLFCFSTSQIVIYLPHHHTYLWFLYLYQFKCW